MRRLLLGTRLNSLELLHEFLRDFFIIDDQYILIIFIFSPVCKVIRTHNDDPAIDDHYFMIHNFRLAIQTDIEPGGDGDGEWFEISQPLTSDKLPQVMSTHPADDLYHISATAADDNLYKILTTEKTGIFVLVKKSERYNLINQ